MKWLKFCGSIVTPCPLFFQDIALVPPSSLFSLIVNSSSYRKPGLCWTCALLQVVGELVWQADFNLCQLIFIKEDGDHMQLYDLFVETACMYFGIFDMVDAFIQNVLQYHEGINLLCCLTQRELNLYLGSVSPMLYSLLYRTNFKCHIDDTCWFKISFQVAGGIELYANL